MQNNTIWEKALAVIASIIAQAPLEKTIKWGSEVFTRNGQNVVSYGVTLIFWGLREKFLHSEEEEFGVCYAS